MKERDRPPIPAELKRRVLVEAGHRCAIPTCRYIQVEIHHITPWASCQAHEYENLIALCPNCHARADANEIDRKALRLYKYNLRFAHDKFSQIEMDLILSLAQQPEGTSALWAPFAVMFLRRSLEAGYLAVSQNPNMVAYTAGMRTSPDHIHITPAGRQFVADLGLIEM